MNFCSICSFENHLLRSDELRRRKVARQSLGRKRLHVRAVDVRGVRHERIARSGMKEGDAATVVEQHRIHLDAFTRRDLSWSATIYADPPEMTTIDVALVSGKYDERFVRRQGDIFYFEIPRRQRRQRTAFSRDGIKVRPAVFLRRKQQSIPCDPTPEIID